MRLYIVTEARRHIFLLQALLLPEIGSAVGQVDISWAGGWSSADSLARTLLMLRRKPVALVVSATTDHADEREGFLRASLGEVNIDSSYLPLVIAPEIESILFTDEAAVEALIRRPLEPKEREQAMTEPYNVLLQVLTPPMAEMNAQNFFRDDCVEDAFRERLPHLDLRRVREHPKIVALRRFVEESLRPGAVLAAA
jgi:hypothetical protein